MGQLDLLMAAAQGAAATAVIYPWLPLVAARWGPIPWSPFSPETQLLGAVLALAITGCAVLNSARPRARLSARDRNQLTVLALFGGLALGLALAATLPRSPSALLLCAASGALLGATGAGSLLFRNDPLGGACVGGVLFTLSWPGTLIAVAATALLSLALRPWVDPALLEAGRASLALALAVLSSLWLARGIQRVDPMLAQSFLERSGNPG